MWHQGVPKMENMPPVVQSGQKCRLCIAAESDSVRLLLPQPTCTAPLGIDLEIWTRSAFPPFTLALNMSRLFGGKARIKIGFWFDANFVVIQCRRGACEGGFWWLDIGARVAQWIRRRSPKPKIGGSSPPVGTNIFGATSVLGTFCQHDEARNLSKLRVCV